MQKLELTNSEKFWAVACHLSALLVGMGVILPVIAWAENRKKSKYVAFQALQALGYQSLGYTIWAMFYAVALIVVMANIMPALRQASQHLNPTTLSGEWVSQITLLSIAATLIYLFPALLGCLGALLGRDFRYPILGARLARFVGYGSQELLDDANENRFAASMGHFCVIFPLTGILVPLTLWAMGGKYSRNLRFQTLQAVVYQVVGTLVFLVFFLATFGTLFVMVLSVLSPQAASDVSIEGMLGVFVSMICFLLVMLAYPMYHILGQWAGLRLLRGDDYRYPLIGRRVQAWLAKREGAVLDDSMIDPSRQKLSG